MPSNPWRIWIDTGGTFTDALGTDPSGRLCRVKVLSSSSLRGRVTERLTGGRLRIEVPYDLPPGFLIGFSLAPLSGEGAGVGSAEIVDHDGDMITLAGPRPQVAPGEAVELSCPDEAPVLAARVMTRTPPGKPLPAVEMRLATTRGTNALLERRGVPVVQFVTRGFGDLLHIGTQQRPDLFTLDIRRPSPLPAHVIEVAERVDSGGSVLEPLDTGPLDPSIASALASGVRHAVVTLMNAYANPIHERRLAAYLRGAGFEEVTVSSDVAPFIELLTRSETAVIEAYLGPLVGDYLERVEHAASAGSLHVLTSAGGLLRAASVNATDCLLSGPAGGVAGAALAGDLAGEDRLIAFDMGGTSTDVSRFDGDFEYVFETRIGDAHLSAPSLAIETVAAGGGSVCRAEHGRLVVGPESAGAVPGPSCYGAGGPLTLTDVNLLLGRLQPGRFQIPISVEASREAADQVRGALGGDGDSPSAPAAVAGPRGDDDPEALLEGFLQIANERMADAIRRVSLRRGYDPSDHTLVAFGGAGGQHACDVAELLGMKKALVPPLAGLLSALGMGFARVERFEERQILRPLRDVADRVAGWIRELSESAKRKVSREGVAASDITVRRRIAGVRFAGQDATLSVEYEKDRLLSDLFEARYEEVFGHKPEGREAELVSLRVVASGASVARVDLPRPPRGGKASPDGTARAYFRRWLDVPTYRRDGLGEGAVLDGPALVFDDHSAVALEPGWSAEVHASGALILRAVGGRRPGPPAAEARPEAARIELFSHRFENLAMEMGEQLRRTAVSVNIKERRDYSCALLDAGGRLVVNAPHIPVHLGSLGPCVRSLREATTLADGDVLVTNHPSFGGSHLPDVTVVTPVFDDARLLGYVASRAHHAEIGGAAPGSMPPAATRLAEEGVVIPPTHIVRDGAAHWDDLRRLLTSRPFPSRAVDDNLADLRAAVAANALGAERLKRLTQVHGAPVIARYMDAMARHAELRIRDALGKLPDGTYTAEERLDDGSVIRVAVTVDGDEARVDFTGSADVHPGNLNATEAVVRAAVIYVLRLLVKEPLPLNEGLMRAVTVVVPRGMLNPSFDEPPGQAPAIVGGNVETSQRIVDALLKALRLVAGSQGTMNNVTFGDDSFGYYETVCGGAGAGPDFDGASAVHTHMTNTRITDPEIIEHRYPVRVERFAIRRGSGGRGRRHGGDGVVREMTFLRPMTLSILSQRRREGPYGLDGGEPGSPGSQRLIRASGEVVSMGSIDGARVEPGDRLVLETPGGGGFGQPGG